MKAGVCTGQISRSSGYGAKYNRKREWAEIEKWKQKKKAVSIL